MLKLILIKFLKKKYIFFEIYYNLRFLLDIL